MSDDLVKRARHHITQIAAWGRSMEPDADLVEELADRIEQLEAALRTVEEWHGCGLPTETTRMIDAALEKKDG